MEGNQKQCVCVHWSLVAQQWTTHREHVSGSVVSFQVEVVFMHSFAGTNVADADERRLATTTDNTEPAIERVNLPFYVLLAVAVPIQIPTIYEPTAEWPNKITKSDGIIVAVRAWFLCRSSRPTRNKKPASVQKD